MTKINRPGLVFLLVFAWKVALFLVSAQPIPANDAFFYDGAVVNRVLNGGYFNPSLAVGLPISGTEVFSAYPPLYQGTLWLWLSLFGASVQAVMSLHLVLFGIYELILFAILKRLKLPLWSLHLAAAYLLVLTFHDRPDTLAHVLGMFAVLAWARSGGEGASRLWPWGMATGSVLCWCTSLQIGATYSLLLGVGMIGAWLWRRQRIPLEPFAFMAIMPVALIVLVKIGFPHLWAGFLEHARQTPSFTGIRVPAAGEVLKIARNVPGTLMVAALVIWFWLKPRPSVTKSNGHAMLLFATLIASIAVIGASLTVVTANMVAIVTWLQPLAVGAFLSLRTESASPPAPLPAAWQMPRWVTVCLLFGAMLGSVRAVGMSTWGLACARDVSQAKALARVEAELRAQQPGTTVVLSSCYLYQAARHQDLRWLHSDWLVALKRGETDGDLRGLLTERPAEIILTQFDYHRRFQTVLEKLRATPACAGVEVENLAHLPPPDAFKSTQQIVQHISWAPVLIRLKWK